MTNQKTSQEKVIVVNSVNSHVSWNLLNGKIVPL